MMSESLEDKLRKALRPVDPGADFTQRVMAQLPTEHSGKQTAEQPRSNWKRIQARLVSVALAASLIVTVTIGWGIYELRQREAGLKARAQVLEALQLTSEKLNLAARAVHERSNRNGDDTGA
jgi:negative regulator of sigma E activity